jgi:uncharacterized repeat protein (TIGR03803 family)
MKPRQMKSVRTNHLSKQIPAVLLFCLAMVVAASAQTYKVVADNGSGSPGFLTLGLDGNFYGTKYVGGNGSGSIFRLTPGGVETTIYSFPGYPYESGPAQRLLLGTDGNFYGTTLIPFGSVFKITPQGTLTTLYTFTCSGQNCGSYFPDPGLVEGRDGNFYGTAVLAGANGWGMMFRVTPGGTFTVVYNFCAQSNCADGGGPGQLIQANDGDFYGTTSFGGSLNGGTIFKITPNGALRVLHNLSPNKFVVWGLTQGSDGNFYGATYGGGAHGRGTVFRMTPDGKMFTLYSFCSQDLCADGAGPFAGLVEGSDGNFYGTTLDGGVHGTVRGGTIFSVTPGGQYSLLYSFCALGRECSDGNAPESTLIQAPNGTFYGTTVNGAEGNSGVTFNLSVKLGSLVEMLPASSSVGQNVKILGRGLSRTIAVSFNGTPATFSIESDTYITAVVPTGATTGYVTVETGRGTLKSNFAFQIRP